MTIFQSVVLGIVQGAGEFLPISSSAHLILVPWLFDFSDPGLAFDVALHFGTLAAVLYYFWRDWLTILSQGLGINKSYLIDPSVRYGKNIFWLLILASIPGAIAGYLLEDMAENTFRSPLLIAFTLSVIGLILYLVDKYHTHRKRVDQITWKDGLIIGISQAVAVIPGVSRSGATITAGLWSGLNRETAARFSFLLSAPIIFGAAFFKMPELLSEGMNVYLITGTLTAALSGYAAIKYLLKLVQKIGYAPFFWYRLILAILIVACYLVK